MEIPEKCLDQRQHDFSRMALCGNRGLRSGAVQACFLIAADLRAQLEEEEGLGPVTLRHDLLSVITDCTSWSLDALRAGETNAKGYMFLAMVSSLLDGLRSGVQKDQLGQMLVASAEDALARCIEIFEGMLNEGSDEVEISPDEIVDIPSYSLSELMGEWAFMVCLGLIRKLGIWSLTPKAGPTESIRLWSYRADELGVYRVSLAQEQIKTTK